MNPDSTRPEPDDDTTAAGSDPDLVDAIALEAVTSAAALPEPAAAGDGADPMVGRQLGTYRLVSRIHGNELVSVYLAERVGSFEQRVAVKRFERVADGKAIVRRFRAVSHVQAALSGHPNIAGLLDAGTDEDGRSYLVIEAVDGRPIDAYCEERRLDVPARLRLFGQVCDAVQVVHRYGIIHRDLKPDNILVTADGVPRLIVFEIAGPIDPGDVGAETAGAETPTPTSELVLTPQYASPEQVAGEPLTTASDVYALGVVLYQLLAGRLPYRLKEWTASEILQAISEQSPERPSAAVVRHRRTASSVTDGRGPEGADRSRERERADSPAAEALPLPDSRGSAGTDRSRERERAVGPAQGDPTVPSALSSESPATEAPPPTLAHDPVPEEIATARGTTPARLRQALKGDLDAIVLMALRKEPERRYASSEQLADDLRRYLDGRPVRARGDSSLYRAGKFARQYPLAVASAAIAALGLVAGVVETSWKLVRARRERDRAEASARRDRRAVDRFFARVSEDRLLDQPGLESLRKEVLQDARRFYEGFLAEHGGDPSLRAEVAGAESRLAGINAGIGSPAEAADRYRQAVSLWEDLLGSHPGDPEYQEGLARTLNQWASVLLKLKGRGDEALGACRRARELIEAALAGDPASAPRRHLLGQVLQNTAQIQFDQGHPREAIETLHRVLEIEGLLSAEYTGSVGPLLVIARANGLLGLALAGQPDGSGPALASYQQAIEILDILAREHPGLAEPSYLLALDLSDQCTLQQMTGKLDSALKSVRRSIEILEGLDRRYPGVLNYQGGLAAAYNLIGDLHRRRLEPAEALAFAEKARTLLERLVAEHPEDTPSRIDLSKSYSTIGRVRQQSGEPAEALRSFRRAIDLLEGLPELDARNSYSLACDLALCIPLIGATEGSQGVHDPEALTEADRLRRRLYGDRAIEVLRKVVGGGALNADVLLSDPDLAAIRDRDDFQRFVKDLEKQAADRK